MVETPQLLYYYYVVMLETAASSSSSSAQPGMQYAGGNQSCYVTTSVEETPSFSYSGRKTITFVNMSRIAYVRSCQAAAAAWIAGRQGKKAACGCTSAKMTATSILYGERRRRRGGIIL